MNTQDRPDSSFDRFSIGLFNTLPRRNNILPPFLRFLKYLPIPIPFLGRKLREVPFINQISTKDHPDCPWDQRSLKLLNTLPKEISDFPLFLQYLIFLIGPLFFIFTCSILIALHIIFVLYENSKYKDILQHSGLSILSHFLPLGIIGVICFLRFFMKHLAEYFMLKKAPLGYFVEVLFEAMGKNKINKARTIANNIHLQTKGNEIDSLRIAFVKGLAFNILAETSPDERSAREMAQKAIPFLKESMDLGMDTPLLHFLLATSFRTINANHDAIEEYRTYLQMRPADKGTGKILEVLTTQS